METCKVCNKEVVDPVMMKPEKPTTNLNFQGNWGEAYGPVCRKHAESPPNGEGLALCLEKEIQRWESEKNSRAYQNAGVWKIVELPKKVIPMPPAPPVPSPEEVEAKAQAARERMAKARAARKAPVAKTT